MNVPLLLALLVVVAAISAGAGAVAERWRTRTRAADAEALHAMTAELASSLDVRRVFELIVNQASLAVQAEQAMLLRVSRGGLLMAAQSGTEDRGPPPLEQVTAALRGSHEPALFENRRVLAARVSGSVGGGLVLWLRRPARPFEAAELVQVVSLLKVGAGAVRNAFHYEERTQQACTDALTGLHNRREFDDQLRKQIARSRRSGEVFSLLLADLDQFKAINDTRGHQAGDRALRETADLLRAAVRAEDLVARFGGDELAILMPGCAADAAREAADRLLKAVRRAAIPTGPGPKVTLSIGCASYPEQGTDAATLIAGADRALYQAKRAGRDRLVLSLPIVAA